MSSQRFWEYLCIGVPKSCLSPTLMFTSQRFSGSCTFELFFLYFKGQLGRYSTKRVVALSFPWFLADCTLQSNIYDFCKAEIFIFWHITEISAHSFEDTTHTHIPHLCYSSKSSKAIQLCLHYDIRLPFGQNLVKAGSRSIVSEWACL